MNALAIDDIRRLSDEQQRMLLALSRLQSQMDHPRGAWREWTQPALVVSAAVVLTVLLLRAGLQWSAARRPRTAMALDIAWPAARAPTHAAPDAPRPKLPEPAPTAPPGTSTGEPVGSAVYRKRSEQYPHGNFGQPDLDNEPPVEVLRRVESLTAEGMQGAAMALLEHHLHQHPGHNPWLLLGLLDVYGDLGQPWNQERVAAQLEVLYNVHIPDLNTAHVEGHDLEQHTEALSCIVQAWPTKDRCDALASILLRTNEHAELDLAAFREALLLHAIARQLEPPDAGPLPFEPLIDWPDNA